MFSLLLWWKSRPTKSGLTLGTPLPILRSICRRRGGLVPCCLVNETFIEVLVSESTSFWPIPEVLCQAQHHHLQLRRAAFLLYCPHTRRRCWWWWWLLLWASFMFVWLVNKYIHPPSRLGYESLCLGTHSMNILVHYIGWGWEKKLNSDY